MEKAKEDVADMAKMGLSINTMEPVAPTKAQTIEELLASTGTITNTEPE